MRIVLVALAVAASWCGLSSHVARFDVMALMATLLGGYPIYREAFENLISRRMTMELSMTIALVAAMAIGEFFTASVIVLFVLIAEALEKMTVGRGRHAIQDLLSFLPQTVTLRRGAETCDVEIRRLHAGDVILIRPGARIPVDGAVASGNSFVDQSAITGEAMPVEKLAGSRVYAGTMNQTGTLDVRTEAIGANTTFGKIISIVEQAEQTRAPVQKLADRLAGYLVYFALGGAVLTYLWSRDIRATISVIIVAGACGIAAGTPLAILGAVGRAARLGAIIKGGIHLEALSAVDTIVLDKTGTLTLGRPKVTAIRPHSGVTPEAVLRAAATAEQPSEHPLAHSILERARALSLVLPPTDHFEYIPGQGILCRAGAEEILVGRRSFLEGHDVKTGIVAGPVLESSEVFVSRNGSFLGSIHVEDTLRPEAVDAVSSLTRMGLKTILLTGDQSAVAQSVAWQLGVDHVASELLPEDKVQWIRARMQEGSRVAMIGDGINDAPALTQASVGVAMGSGTDVARESADIILIGDDLLKFVETLRIARRCRRIIWQNFTGTLLVDGAGVALAAFGFLNPLLAAFIHVTSELAFILNSTRLLPARRKY